MTSDLGGGELRGSAVEQDGDVRTLAEGSQLGAPNVLEAEREGRLLVADRVRDQVYELTGGRRAASLPDPSHG